jgi:hypothetical protein
MLERILVRLRALLQRARVDQELDEELRFHLERDIERGIARGLSAEEARFAARRSFGNPTAATEQVRDALRWNWLDNAWSDVLHAVRMLRRSPVITSVAVLSLALGIGANTAVFTVVNAVLLKELPVRDPDRLVWVRVDERFPTVDYPTCRALS